MSLSEKIPNLFISKSLKSTGVPIFSLAISSKNVVIFSNIASRCEDTKTPPVTAVAVNIPPSAFTMPFTRLPLPLKIYS